jgi:exosome complex RNA-binding protein Rrp42 (RNase PH superfamily)
MIQSNLSSLPEVKLFLQKGLRMDGRSLTDRRDFILEESERLQTNSLHGCRIQNPETGNWIYFSLTGQIAKESPSIKLQIQYPKVLSSSGKSHQKVPRSEAKIGSIINSSLEQPAKRFHEVGIEENSEVNASDSQTSELKCFIESLLISKLDLKELELEGQPCSWHLILNVFSLSPLGLHDLDYLLFGLRHTLVNVDMPMVSVSLNALSKQFTFEVLSDTKKIFKKNELPTIFLIGEIKGNLLVDLSAEELEVVDSLYVASFRKNGVLREIQKVDGRPVQMGVVNRVLMMTRRLVVDAQS